MRYDIYDDLYLVTTSTTFFDLTSNLWHNRRDLPTIYVLHSLRNNDFICCEPSHVKFPFFKSQTITLMPFDILNSDL